MKSRTLIFLCLCLIPTLTFGQMSIFARNLFVGMHGDDIRALQKFLNTDTETRVAEFGAGSLGNETDYFGLGTKRALIKFQEKYRAEVLVPAGLVSGTGFFGEKTRAKMNALMGVSAVSGPSAPYFPLAPTAPAPIFEKGSVIVMFPSQYSGVPNTMITISGAGFTATDNTIYFGNDHAVVKAMSWNGQNITFKVPNISKGIYSLFVKNARGESNKDAFFVVTDGVTPEPKIESLTPERVLRGGAIEIKGSGFATKGNMVRSSVSVTENIPSADRTSLSFTIPATLFKETPTLKAGDFSIPVWIYVINENGVSNEKKFILDF